MHGGAVGADALQLHHNRAWRRRRGGHDDRVAVLGVAHALKQPAAATAEARDARSPSHAML